MRLSKSRYVRGLQCTKMLWMDKNMPSEKTIQTNEVVFETGQKVGELAQQYFVDIKIVKDSENKREMLEETERLMSEKAKAIAEASFSYDGNFCSVDILKRLDDDTFEIIEVKSSSGDEEQDKKIKKIYLDDLAYQYYVLTKLGIKVTKTTLMLLNKNYVRQGELNIKELFVLTNCTNDTLLRQEEIATKIAMIKKVASADTEPTNCIGDHCNKPYECAYKTYCWRNLPENNIFEIGWRTTAKVKDAAYQNDHITFNDVLVNNIKLNEKAKRQVETTIHDLPPHIDKNGINEFLNKLSYPVYHIDFEYYGQAVPEWNGIRPYQSIMFQYSIHIEHEDGTLVHKEYLAPEGIDPMREFAEKLCAHVPKDACVTGYSAGTAEKPRLKNLAEMFPDLAEHLLAIHDNMIDLAEPFANGHYYQKEMGGSFSIKKVLPALLPNNSELDYNALRISNGGDAMNIYANLHNHEPASERKQIREDLLKYCYLDTLAMVRVHQKLREFVK